MHGRFKILRGLLFNNVSSCRRQNSVRRADTVKPESFRKTVPPFEEPSSCRRTVPPFEEPSPCRRTVPPAEEPSTSPSCEEVPCRRTVLLPENRPSFRRTVPPAGEPSPLPENRPPAEEPSPFSRTVPPPLVDYFIQGFCQVPGAFQAFAEEIAVPAHLHKDRLG